MDTNISSNTLFHFTTEKKYLTSILKNGLFVRYSLENYQNLINNKAEIVFPMTCFCDIPLHQISYHAEGNSLSSNDKGYGKFSIAFHKKFGIEKGIQPIHYLNQNSAHVEELTNTMDLLLNQGGNSMKDNEVLTNFIFEYIRMIKPYVGKMKRIDKDNNIIEITIEFSR